MKKKRNFLTIISSIFGVVAICGLSLFSMLDHKKETQRAEAVDTYLYQDGFSFTNTYTMLRVSGSGPSTKQIVLGFTGSFAYYQSYNNGSVSYNGTITLIPSLVDNGYDASFLPSSSTLSIPLSNLPTPSSSHNFKLTLIGIQIPEIDIGKQLQFGVKFFVDDVQDTQVQSNNFILSYTYSGSYVYGLTYRIGSLSDDIFNLDYSPSDAQQQYNIGYENGYNDGNTNGYNNGYTNGFDDGNSQGYSNGYEAGKTDAELIAQQQIENAYQSGYADGYNEGNSQDSTVSTIFSGILQVALVPVNFFLAIFNFEILGINLSAFIRAIFTVVLTIIVLKTVLGKGGGGSDN